MAQHTSRAVAALAFTILVWGVAPAYIRSFSLALGPDEALVIRAASVALLSIVLLPFFGGFRFAASDLPRLLFISFVGLFGYFYGTIFGFARVHTATGSIIISTQPLLIAFVAALLGAERLRLPAIAGLVISFAGTLLLFGGGELDQVDVARGGLLIFSAGLAWAFYVVLARPLIRTYGAIKITAATSILGAIPALAFATPRTLDAALALRGEALFSLFYLTVIGTLLSVSTWNYATGHLRPTTVGSSLYLIPLIAFAAGWFILGESVSSSTIIAGAVILSGVALAQFGPRLQKSRFGTQGG